MAVQHANRGIVKKDLQLYYNREWLKSFKGQASNNLVYGGHFPNGYGMPQEAGSNPANQVVYYPQNPGGYSDYVLRTSAIGGNIYTEYQLNLYNIESSTTYCMSCWYAVDSFWNGSSSAFHCRAFSSSGNHAATGTDLGTTIRTVNLGGLTWIYCYKTITSPSDATGVMEWYLGYPSNNTAGYRYFTNVQIEKGTYPTPYNDIANNINTRNNTVTNLLTSTYSSLYTNWTVDGSGQSTIGSYSYIENNSTVRITDVNSNTRFSVSLLPGFSASTFYTFSVKYRKVSGTPTLRFQIVFFGSDNSLLGYLFPTTSEIHIYDKDGWQVAWYTVIGPSFLSKVTFFIQDGDDYTTYNHVYDLKDPQIQTGKYATAWISSSCSGNATNSGGGLYDLSGNNINADLTNVSFDVNGYLFTGASSNRIQFTTPTSFIYSAAGKTVLMWVKYSSTGYVGFCGLGNAANGQSFNLRSPAATVQYLGFMGYNADYDPSAGPQINNNVWHLIGATFDAYGAGNLKLYVDGVNVASTTNTLNTAPEASNIGYIGRSSHTGAEGYLTGQVGQFMLYNRALSADEVLQIFNSQRKTYGV